MTRAFFYVFYFCGVGLKTIKLYNLTIPLAHACLCLLNDGFENLLTLVTRDLIQRRLVDKSWS